MKSTNGKKNDNCFCNSPCMNKGAKNKVKDKLAYTNIEKASPKFSGNYFLRPSYVTVKEVPGIKNLISPKKNIANSLSHSNTYTNIQSKDKSSNELDFQYAQNIPSTLTNTPNINNNFSSYIGVDSLNTANSTFIKNNGMNPSKNNQLNPNISDTHCQFPIKNTTEKSCPSINNSKISSNFVFMDNSEPIVSKSCDYSFIVKNTDSDDPIGFSLETLPIPCAYLRLPWPSDKPYCRLMPDSSDQVSPIPSFQRRESHAINTSYPNTTPNTPSNIPNYMDQLKNSYSLSMANSNFNTPHYLIVKRMYIERLSYSPSAYLIRYVFSPNIYDHTDALAENLDLVDEHQFNDFRYNFAYNDVSDKTLDILFQKSSNAFSGFRVLGLGFSVAGVTVTHIKSHAAERNNIAYNDVCLIYFRLKLSDLPFNRRELEKDWETRRKEIQTTVSTIVIVFDFRFSPLITPNLNHLDKIEQSNYYWTPECMRRLVHLTAQTHSILDSWLVNNLQGRELTIIHIPPLSFSNTVDTSMIRVNQNYNLDDNFFLCTGQVQLTSPKRDEWTLDIKVKLLDMNKDSLLRI